MNDNQLQQPLHQPIYDRRSPPGGEDKRPCGDYGQRIALTEKSVALMERTLETISTKMDILIGTMTKVALLEEKHGNQQLDISRAHIKLTELTEKLDRLAEETRGFIKFTEGQNKVLWALGAAVAGLFVKALFFTASHGMTP